MNIEFIKNDDGSCIITDEKGIIKKTNEEISVNELLIQNKIEMVDKRMEEMEGLEKLNKSWSNAYGYAGVVLLIPFIVFTLFNFNIDPVILTCIRIPSLGLSLFQIIPWYYHKNEQKGFKIKLTKAKELKQVFEKELESEKQHILKEEMTNNKSISFVKQNEIESSLIDKQLGAASHNDTYLSDYYNFNDITDEKCKKLIRKK